MKLSIKSPILAAATTEIIVQVGQRGAWCDSGHGRRIKIEEKAKLIAALWGRSRYFPPG